LKLKLNRKSANVVLAVWLIIGLFLVIIAVGGATGKLDLLPGGTILFGNSSIGSYPDQNDVNGQSVSYFVCSVSGSVTDIVAYVSGSSSGQAITALYGDDGSLISDSNVVNIGTSFSWVDFQLQYPYTTAIGHTYGLAIMGNVGLNVMTDISGPGVRNHNVGDFASGFSNPFGGILGSGAGAMSIYAFGTTSTPAATPTPAPGSETVTMTISNGGGTILASWATGSNEVSSTFYVFPGTYVQFKETPNQGFQFNHWILNGAGAGGTQILGPIQINAGTTVEAVFTQVSPTAPPPTPPIVNAEKYYVLGLVGLAILGLSCFAFVRINRKPK
jgi:hypothetical protein